MQFSPFPLELLLEKSQSHPSLIPTRVAVLTAQKKAMPTTQNFVNIAAMHFDNGFCVIFSTVFVANFSNDNP